MRVAPVFILTWLTLFSAGAADLPAELKPVEQALTNEEHAVVTVRALHLEKRRFAQEVEGKKLTWAGTEEEFNVLYQEAVRGLQIAKQGYELALASFPKNAALHNYFGELLYDELGEEPAALREWNLALSLDPEHSAAYNNLGIHLLHVGQYKEGLRHLDRAIELDDENPDYLFNLVQAYLAHLPDIEKIRGWKKEKVCKEALKLSKKAAHLSPDDFSLLRDHALNYFVVANYDVDINFKDAVKAWQDARAKAPRQDQVYESWLHEARMWMKAKDGAEALRCIGEARKLKPEGGEVLDKMTQQAEALQADGGS